MRNGRLADTNGVNNVLCFDYKIVNIKRQQNHKNSQLLFFSIVLLL